MSHKEKLRDLDGDERLLQENDATMEDLALSNPYNDERPWQDFAGNNPDGEERHLPENDVLMPDLAMSGAVKMEDKTETDVPIPDLAVSGEVNTQGKAESVGKNRDTPSAGHSSAKSGHDDVDFDNSATLLQGEILTQEMSPDLSVECSSSSPVSKAQSQRSEYSTCAGRPKRLFDVDDDYSTLNLLYDQRKKRVRILSFHYFKYSIIEDEI